MRFKNILNVMFKRVLAVPAFGSLSYELYALLSPKEGWNRTHPFDRAYGVRTSGSVPGSFLSVGANSYAAAQPSIIRKSLAAIPFPAHCHFFDCGCGMGRPLFIATEFGFSSVTGLETCKTLAWMARKNSALFARNYPKRTPIRILTTDALSFRFPEDDIVLFLYNPFGKASMVKLLQNIEQSLISCPKNFYIIYYNPTWAEVLDGSSKLERRYAEQIPYHTIEVGYGPDTSDAVVIWQNTGNPHPRPTGNPYAPVRIVKEGVRAEIEAPLP
jgi:hypothetical protein